MLLATLLYLIDLLDGIDGLCPDFAVVFGWNISTFLKLKRRIDGELFAGEFAVDFGPFCLSWILLSVECLPALLAAESELLKLFSKIRYK